jgi:hypothetical protein
LHAIGLNQFAVARCFWCAPTPRVFVAVLPCVSFGGALFVPPWQLLHGWFVLTSRLPSM